MESSETNAEMRAEHHADRYVALAEQARAVLHGPAAAAWLDRPQRETDYLRDALRWLAKRQRPEDVERALRLAGWTDRRADEMSS